MEKKRGVIGGEGKGFLGLYGCIEHGLNKEWNSSLSVYKIYESNSHGMNKIQNPPFGLVNNTRNTLRTADDQRRYLTTKLLSCSQSRQRTCANSSICVL